MNCLNLLPNFVQQFRAKESHFQNSLSYIWHISSNHIHEDTTVSALGLLGSTFWTQKGLWWKTEMSQYATKFPTCMTDKVDINK